MEKEQYKFSSENLRPEIYNSKWGRQTLPVSSFEHPVTSIQQP